MTSRVLPMSEYQRLTGTEAETVWPMLTKDALVVVIERDGTIIGCTVLIPVYHADCVWIHPDHRRRVGVWRALRRAIEATAQSVGLSALAVAATTGVMRRFLESVEAITLPGEHFVWVLKQQRSSR